MADNHRVTQSYDYNAICDICGFKYKASKLRKNWLGQMVCEADFETRHISDFYATRNDTHTLPFIRTKEGTTAYPELGVITATSGAGVTTVTTAHAISGNMSATMKSSVNNSVNACWEAWIKPSALDNARRAIFSTAGGNDNGGFCLEVGGANVQGFNNCLIAGYVSGGIYSAFCRSISGVIKIGMWQHVAYSRFGNAQYLYVNGQPVATEIAATPVTILQNNSAMWIGRRTSTLSPFMGAIRDIRVFTNGRTQNEIQRDMNNMNSQSGTTTYLTAWYKLNDASTIIVDSVTNDPSTMTVSTATDVAWNYDYF